MLTTPTQVRRPWRSTVRTLFQAALGFCSMWAVLVEAAGLDTRWQWVSASLVVTAAVARVMAVPAVEVFLRRFVPWLAADPLPHLTAGPYTGPQPQGDAHRR